MTRRTPPWIVQNAFLAIIIIKRKAKKKGLRRAWYLARTDCLSWSPKTNSDWRAGCRINTSLACHHHIILYSNMTSVTLNDSVQVFWRGWTRTQRTEILATESATSHSRIRAITAAKPLYWQVFPHQFRTRNVVCLFFLQPSFYIHTLCFTRSLTTGLNGRSLKDNHSEAKTTNLKGRQASFDD